MNKLTVFAAHIPPSVAPKDVSDYAYRLLGTVLTRYYGICPGDYTIERSAMGKPHLVTDSGKTMPHFNISHTNGLVVIAVGDVPVGIDAERSDRAISEAIRRRWLNGCGAYEAVLEWTRRESYGKLTGEGFNVKPPYPKHTHRTWIYGEYCVTLCVHSADSVCIPDGITVIE